MACALWIVPISTQGRIDSLAAATAGAPPRTDFSTLLLDTVSQAVIAVDATWRVISWNRAATTLYGWDADEALGRPIRELIGTVGSAHEARIVAAIARGEAWSGEYWVQPRHGVPIPVFVTDTPVFDATGSLTAVIGVSADISERKHAEATQRLLAAIVESSADPILSGGTDGTIITWNRAASDLYGYTAEEAIGQHASMIMPEDRLEEFQKVLERVASGEPVKRLETMRIAKDGSQIRVLINVVPLLDDHAVVIGASSVEHDITERVRAEQERQEAEVRFQATFKRSSFGMAMSDLEGRPTAVNVALCQLLGRRPDELIGRRWTAYAHPDEIPLGLAVRSEVRAGADSFSDERRYVRADGSTVWALVHVNLVRSVDDEPLYYMVQMHDITDRKQMERELEHRALHDDLTGLPNRALLGDRLSHALAASQRTGSQTGVVFLDVDGFKNVNDALGHAAGDQLLVEVGHRLKATVRPADTVARFGGDEFVVVCEGITVESMTALARGISAAMTVSYSVDGREVALHASLGITVSRFESTAERLLSEADAAMYRAKELGRDRAAVFDDSLRTRAAAILEGEQALRMGLGRGEFVVYYQPIVDIRTGEGVGVEALVRWHTADGRVVPPSEFIPLAESAGLIVPLGEVVLGQAAAQAARWNAQAPTAEPLWVSVNLSARQLTEPRLASQVSDVLRASRLPAGLLHLEITETVVMDNVAQSIVVLDTLRRLGVHLSIDDFGTGYSSLAYLKQLPFDTLKIDRSFVDGLGSDPNDTSIVRAVISLGHALGLRCVAEGVETAAQQAALVDLGCHFGQGYLWHRPLAPLDADAWARGRSTRKP